MWLPWDTSDKMKRTPKLIFGLEIRCNCGEPLSCYSEERGGLSVDLYRDRSGGLTLDVSVKKRGRRSVYSLPGLIPGDRLSFKYALCRGAPRQTIAGLRKLADRDTTHRLKKGFRWGLDVTLKSGEVIRVSHPERGGFSFLLSNVPLDHARNPVMAWNRTELWHWQLNDLNPGEKVALQIVETDWWDDPPLIKRKSDSRRIVVRRQAYLWHFDPTAKTEGDNQITISRKAGRCTPLYVDTVDPTLGQISVTQGKIRTMIAWALDHGWKPEVLAAPLIMQIRDNQYSLIPIWEKGK